MVVLRNLPAPFGEPIARQPRKEYKNSQDPQAGLMPVAWVNWFTALQNQNDSTPVKAASESLSDENAAIPSTDFTNGGVNGGEYRLSYWYGVTSPGIGSSALQVDFNYTYRGVTKTINGANLTGNTTTEAESDVKFIPLDGKTPVTYTVTYSTGLGAPMQYDLRICLESVPL